MKFTEKHICKSIETNKVLSSSIQMLEWEKKQTNPQYIYVSDTVLAKPSQYGLLTAVPPEAVHFNKIN